MGIDEFISLSVKQNISDLHLCNTQSARWRRNGMLEIAPVCLINPQTLLADWLTPGQQKTLAQQGHIDFSVSLPSGTRVRGNAFRQYQGISLALRLLPQTCPLLADLDTPAPLTSLLNQQDGLILVTGATGSGKSTTLIAMVNFINQHSQRHIITLEDPIEFVHQSAHCLIQQREIPGDCPSFASGLRAALREDPDVILIGELRDRETIQLALTAAETGHLVLATLHSRGAPQAADRIVDVFPAEEKNLIRCQLASSLKAVLSQKLESCLQGGRIALYELLINTPAIATLIRDGKGHQLAGVLENSQQQGMQSFRQSRAQRISQGKVALQPATRHDVLPPTVLS